MPQQMSANRCHSDKILRTVALSAILALLLFSCGKDNIADRKNIIGLWKLTEYTFSNGSNSGWRTTFLMPPHYTEFTEDQKMIDIGDSVQLISFLCALQRIQHNVCHEVCAHIQHTYNCCSINPF
jgi:hypothetical protein